MDMKLAVTDLDDADADTCVCCGGDADEILSVAFGMDGWDVGVCTQCSMGWTVHEFFRALREAARG